MKKEIWKDIPEYEGLYQVSNLGNIKCLPKKWISGKNCLKEVDEKIMSKGITRGYYQVKLHKNKKYKNYRVHQLVAMAFLSHKPCGMK
jgi:hypothetical protein